ncbi:hypothetical protein [Streptomyces sp. 8N706]|uniref:hypothetical protein n=1 Tax=Streptomyces sp. 8N706 TaxID=3457416 RepID=UPI003FD4B107
MAKTSLRGRADSGTTRQRTVAAAARAAAKRAQKARGSTEPGEAPAGRTGTADEPATQASRRAGDGARGESAAGGEKRSRQWSVPLSAVLAVLVVAGLVATAMLGWEYREAERTGQARTQALAGARKAAPEILSYDYRRLDRDFAAARGHLTGSFLGKYRKTTATVVAPTAKKYHGVVKATVAKPPGGGESAASVVSAAPDKVVVLLFVNQVTNSTQTSGPRLDLNRVRMTLVDTSKGWKVSALDAL